MTSLFSSIFTGHYAFSLYISSPKIDMRGSANFRSCSHYLKHYHEEGSYISDGNERAFYQNQLFVVYENHLFIFKSSGSLLHKFNLTKKKGFPIHLNHMHQCDKDQYIVDFWIHSHDKLFTFYRVLGANKDYSITTHFNRISHSVNNVR